MKINPRKNGGNVLFATLFTTGIICLYLGSYLSLVRSENKITKRSQTWNMAIPIAEAGIEEALTYLQSTFPAVKATGKWTDCGNSVVKTNILNANEFYVVGIFPPSVANGTTTPVIVSEGFVKVPVGTNFISRTIRVKTKLDSYAMPGMVVVTRAILNGNKLSIDSFNSTNSTFSTDGKYDKAKRGDKALLATLSSITNAIDLGNADVWGKVASPYLGSPPKTGAQSSVGSLQWHKDGHYGIEPGAYTDDVNTVAVTPQAPFTVAPSPVPLLGVTTLTSGDYAVDNLSGVIRVTGQARLLVRNSFNISSLTVSNLTGDASLELYVSAPSADISGTSVNVQGQASNFKFFGLPGNKTITAGGNGQFTAMVYAPDSDLTLKGGGSAQEDFSGTCLVKSVNMAGIYSFHFDEACSGKMLKGFVTVSWDELAVGWNTILTKQYTAKNLD